MKLFKGAKKLAALVLAATMVIGGSCLTVMAAGNSHVLDVSTLTKGDAGTWADNEKVKADDYFSLYMSAKTRIEESGEKTWADGYVSKNRINFSNAVSVGEAPINAIEFTTKSAATVNIWWVEADAGLREMVILAADGTEVAKTTEGAKAAKNDPVFSTLKLDKAGTYYLGGTPNKNYIFKVEVVESAADAVPKTGVVSATVIMGAVALASAGVAVVTGKKKED